MSWTSIPTIVVQSNKRDLADIVAEEEAHRRWGSTGVPVHFSCALHGVNVVEVFLAVAEKMYEACDERMKLATRHELSKEAFLKQLGLRTPPGQGHARDGNGPRP